MFSSLSGVSFLFEILPHLNILYTSSEKRHYTENTNYFKHGVQLLHTFSSKLTIIADYEHQQVKINSVCLLCTLNTIAALFSCRSGTPFYARLTYRTQHCNRTRFRWSTSRKCGQYSFCCKPLQSTKLTRLRSELLSGKFFLLPWTPLHGKTSDTWMVNCHF